MQNGHSLVVNEIHDEEGGDDGGNKGGDTSELNLIVHWSDFSDLEDVDYASDGEFSSFQFDADVSSTVVFTSRDIEGASLSPPTI